MTVRTNDLLLWLPLNDYDRGEFTDASGFERATTYDGEVDLVADDLFGTVAVLETAGSRIEVLDTDHLTVAEDLTIEAWVKVDEVPAGELDLLTVGTPGASGHLGLSMQFESWGTTMTYRHDTGNDVVATIDEFGLGRWLHLAAVRSGSRVALYVEGVERNWLDVTEPETSDPAGLRIGHANGAGVLLTRVRMYGAALSPDELRSNADADRLGSAAFREAHPLAFSLYDDDDQYVLYIDDRPTADRALHLEVRNTSSKELVLHEHAGGMDHHLDLTFRPGTLSPTTIERISDDPTSVVGPGSDWRIALADGGADSGQAAYSDTVTLRLTYTGHDRFVFPGDTRGIRLAHMAAAAAGGARNTRVTMTPGAITYATPDETLIGGTRGTTIHVASRVGSSHIPLEAGIVGPSQVLNDGISRSDLCLRLVNNARSNPRHYAQRELRLRGDTIENRNAGIAPTELIVAFGVDDSSSVELDALCNASTAGAVELHARIVASPTPVDDPYFPEGADEPYFPEGADHAAPADFGASPTYGDRRDDGPGFVQASSPIGMSRQWVLRPVADCLLQPGDAVEIVLSGIVSSLPSGVAAVLVDYENIEGYWSGRLSIPVVKAPLRFAANPGVDTGTAAAHIASLGSTLLYLQSTNSGSISGQPNHTDIDFQTHSTSDISTPNARIRAIEAPPAIAHEYSPSGGELMFATKNADTYEEPTERMRIDSRGNVGIATTSPGHKLQIGDSSALDEMSLALGTNAASWRIGTGGGLGDSLRVGEGAFWYGTWLEIDKTGNVGLGDTIDTDFRLNVSGNIKLGSGPQDGPAGAMLSFGRGKDTYIYESGVRELKVVAANGIELANDTTASHDLTVAHDLRVDHNMKMETRSGTVRRPVAVRRYYNLGNNFKLKTGYSRQDFDCFIGGVRINNYDPYEYGMDGAYYWCWAYMHDGYWWVRDRLFNQKGSTTFDLTLLVFQTGMVQWDDSVDMKGVVGKSVDNGWREIDEAEGKVG